MEDPTVSCTSSEPCFEPLDSVVRKVLAMRFISRLFREEDGQDMVEYALLAAFISIVAIITIRNIGPLITAIYQRVEAALT
jgi:Flp pilus assembly pilin Flp